MFNINTRGQFFVAQQAYKHLSTGGRLILISSISASAKGVHDHAVYAGSKAAVEAFARCLAAGETQSKLPMQARRTRKLNLAFSDCVDFGDKRITVNAIAPGGVKTDMYKEAARKYIPGASEWSDEKVEAAVSKMSPLGRIAVPDDIAQVVAFLASDEAGWINGQSDWRCTYLMAALD